MNAKVRFFFIFSISNDSSSCFLVLTVKGDPNIQFLWDMAGPVLSGRIVPDVSKYRNAAFFSVKLDPEKDEGTTIRRNVRNHTPPRLEGSAASP
jgi:hypothetical protein